MSIQWDKLEILFAVKKNKKIITVVMFLSAPFGILKFLHIANYLTDHVNYNKTTCTVHPHEKNTSKNCQNH